MHIAPINSNNYSNKYNNRTSFKNLKIGGMLKTKPDLMQKIQESIPIAKVAAYWHRIGSDLKVDFGPNYYEKKLLDLVAINKGEIHYCSINENQISAFNAKEVIKFMESHRSKNITSSNSGMKKML